MTDRLSWGAWIILLIAISTSIVAAVLPHPDKSGIDMWLFAPPHVAAYAPVVEQWNASEHTPLNQYVINLAALRRRMLAGFLSDTPIADLIEADVNAAARAFTGPLEDVGFVDLTDRIHEEGIYDQINAPSFAPWTSRGRIFGLPHDVHPVLLCYRADIVEAAGIDVSRIETWAQFAETLRPLIKDLDGDGRPDRYLLNFWEHQMDPLEALLLQAGGRYFDDQERVVISSETNARLLATLVTWLTGPGRIAIDAEEFQAHGNKLKLDGRVIAALMPDWLCGWWKHDLPQLEGKLKLMPLPAWEPGGRRTSVWGGTMLGIAKTSQFQEEAWELAKRLYLSKETAQRVYETNGIISPARQLWKQEFYDEPDPFFSGQSPGRMYIEQAPHVPIRTSSAFNRIAKETVRDALIGLKSYANRHQLFEIEALLPEARERLEKAQAAVNRRIERNVFLKEHLP